MPRQRETIPFHVCCDSPFCQLRLRRVPIRALLSGSSLLRSRHRVHGPALFPGRFPKSHSLPRVVAWKTRSSPPNSRYGAETLRRFPKSNTAGSSTSEGACGNLPFAIARFRLPGSGGGPSSRTASGCVGAVWRRSIRIG